MSTNKTIKNSRTVTQTVYGNALMTANSIGAAYPVLEHTTLNELFEVQAGVKLEPTDRPRIGYYCIGIGGHGTQSFNYQGLTIDRPSLYKHDPKDAGLYAPVPFVMRRTNNDLTSEERAKYALRVKRDVNGVEYFCYYLKRLDLTQKEIQILQDEMRDGKVTTNPFVPSRQNLSPKRPELSPRGVVVASNEKLRNSVNFSIVFDENDAREYLDVARILFDGVEENAIISEIGICSGVDRLVSGTSGGGQAIQYKEVLATQICTHITTHRSVSETNMGFSISMDMGSRDAMLMQMDLDTTAIYKP